MQNRMPSHNRAAAFFVYALFPWIVVFEHGDHALRVVFLVAHINEMIRRYAFLIAAFLPASLFAQTTTQTIADWQMQDSAKVAAAAPIVSSTRFHPQNWCVATVPGTVLAKLVNNKVYPEPLYGENMRQIPESLNKTSYWYRTTFNVPAEYKGRHVWLHFAGINYSAEIWVNAHQAGTMKGAFIRGDFDITQFVKPGKSAVLAVLVAPQPHPGVPIEHNVANGVGKNGGDTALDGATFLSTIGWDWLPAVRDRDTGIWLPVTMDVKGPLLLKDPFITSDLSNDLGSAVLRIEFDLENLSKSQKVAKLLGTIQREGHDIKFSVPVE